MEDFLIGLFLNLLAKFIKNPASAQKYQDQLEHINNGITAVLDASNKLPPPKA